MANPDIELEKRVETTPEYFGRLYELNHDRIFNYILYTTRDIELAFDLTSEMYFKVLRALPKYEYRGVSFASWLYSVASREISTFYRRQKRSRTINMPSLSYSDEIEEIRLAVNHEMPYSVI